jgi:surfeit locus 1 family protein
VARLNARQRSVAVLVAALLGAALTARLGWWQLDRAEQKTALQRALDERGSLPALDAAALPRDPATAAAQHYRPVRLHGQWLAEKTVYLENRPMNGRAGFIVVTPLRLDGGAVLVQRGWFARDATERTRLPHLVTPSGAVSVQGLLAAPPSRLYEFSDARATGPIRQNLDLAEFALETGLKLYPVSVLQADAAGNQGDGLLRQWPRPAFDVHKNYGYAAQWFALAALITGLYVWFQIVRPRFRAQRR